MSIRPRLVVGISGSSAPHLGVAVLQALAELGSVDTHLIISPGARKVIKIEMGVEATEVEKMATTVYDPHDLAAGPSSGSFLTIGMVVAPCSMKTLASIATGVSDNLLTRAADVCLKERRRLVLVPRETPLNLIHLRNMETVTMAGATVLPPVPAFYHGPQTIDDLLRHTAGKILDQFQIEHQLFRRWE